MTTPNNRIVKVAFWKSSFQFQMINEQVLLTRSFGGSTIRGQAEVAQLVEHLTENQGVTSSILVLGTGKREPPAMGGFLLVPLNTKYYFDFTDASINPYCLITRQPLIQYHTKYFPLPFHIPLNKRWAPGHPPR